MIKSNCKKDLLSMTKDNLKEVMKDAGCLPYRADQVFSFLHKNRVRKIRDMSNIPLEVRERLSSDYEVAEAVVVDELHSEDGSSKYLTAFFDGQAVEMVVMDYRYGTSVCISTQAGCRMGCGFCASSKGGLSRNLTPGEMLSQVYLASDARDKKISNVVLMGTGEPLDNFCNVILFYDIITDKSGYGLSNRGVTVSTCGLADRIRALADEKKGITLSVSLHAVTDEKRRIIMPIAAKYPLEELIESCIYYYRTTSRRVTLEYAVIPGFNDTLQDADGLLSISKRISAHINLIPINSIEKGISDTDRKNAERFLDELNLRGANVTLRRTLGADIMASCGQLRNTVITRVERRNK
jgi:23S rRNA (adenine2503-C2)-methyltransferase